MRFLQPVPPIKRIVIIVLASLGILTLVLVAASLQNLELKPAQAYISGEENQTNVFPGFTQLVDDIGSLSIGEALILVGGFIVLFVLMLAMLSPEARKRVLKTILRVGLTVWAIYYALNKFRPEGVFGIEGEMPAYEQGSEAFTTPPPYTPPVIPPWVNYVASLLVVLVFVGIGFWLYRFLRPPKRQFQNLARAARSALKDLSEGRDWDDTVIQCYARMSEAVQQERGLQRQQAMTPQEFAFRLEQAGLPSDPVQRLTRLFEKARYGGKKSDRQDVNEAVTCLTAILQAVGAQA